ncbi:MAG: serine/threonine-protein kinase [Gemmatimonadota bacterium]|nr:serine/threonine-protein kinase [Gemmatimonadota bacterium]
MSLSGVVLGKYRILGRLGEGGMGAVYHARDQMLDREVAIKVLRPDLASQGALVERFRAEAVALARLAHPRIGALHGLEQDGTQFLMIMEYLHGETLEALVLRTGGLPWRRAAELCAMVCEALDHAHDQGVVHRDIKPANIMLTSIGTIKVMDFGIARVAGQSRQTQVGRSIGTPMYMAPEQLRGEEVDGRADLYALGAVLYELITGRLAFDADSDYSLMMKQLNEPPPVPSTSVPGVPTTLDAVIRRAMAKRAADRYASASAMRGALERLVRETPVEAATAQPRPLPETRLVRDTPASGPAAVPATRLAPDHAPASPPATRLAPDAPPAPAPTRLAGEPATLVSAWIRDWRAWAAAAVLVLGAALAIRANREVVPTETTLVSVPPEAVAPAPPPLEAPARPSAPTPDPRLERARPIPVEGAKKPAPPPAAPPRQPLPSERQGPVQEAVVPPASPPEPDANAERSAVGAAVATWLAAIGSGSGAGLAGLASEPKSHADLLELVRSGRVTIASQEPSAIEITGSTASATVTTILAHRSSFGATRRTEVRFALELAGEATRWRVTRARILGSPRLN